MATHTENSYRQEARPYGRDNLMAARLNPKQDERARSAIKTSQLINRLNSFALGEVDMNGPVEIDSTRLRAIEILLKKTLPDLSNVTIEGGENPLDLKLTVTTAIVDGD